MNAGIVLPSLSAKGSFEKTLGGAFNDPLSNMVYLGDEVTRTDAIDGFRAGTYPTECLAPFLHESTHHYCFDTPFGYALLGVESFSRMSWWKAIECRRPLGEVSVCSANATCFNRALVRSIYRLFTPMAEGLALYGELDATPGNGLGVSSIVQNAVAVFRYAELKRAHVAGVDPLNGIKEYAAWIAEERLGSGSRFEQTRQALSSHESAPSVEPYRIGYTWISDLVDRMNRHSKESREDRDVTLAFLCSYFFRDWHLALLVSRASWGITHGKPQTTLEDIAEYVQKRIAYLRSSASSALFSEFDRRLASGVQFGCHFNCSAEVYQQLELFNAQASAAELNYRSPKVSRHRHVLRIATMEADSLTLNAAEGTFRCELEGIVIQGRGLVDGFPSRLKQGSETARGEHTAVELALIGNQVLALLFYGGNLVGVLDRDFNSPDIAAVEDLLGDISPFVMSESWRSNYWHLLNPSVDTTCRAQLDEFLDRASNLAQRLYIC